MTPELRKEIRKSRISDSFQKIVECYRDGKTPEGKSIDNISNELYNELFYDMDNVLSDGIEDKIKEIIKSPKSSPNKKPFEILSLLGLYNGEFYDKDIEDSNDDECINKYINVSIDGLPKKERTLDRPVAYSLVDIFKELKFGRPAASQQYLQECIEFLEKGGDAPNVSDLPNISDDKLPNFKFTPPAPKEIEKEIKPYGYSEGESYETLFNNKEPYGYMLIKPENREEVFFMIGYKIYYCEDIIITKDEDIIKLSEAGVLNEWFVPVFICDKETLVFGFPDGFMNIGITTDGYLIADTNSSADWRTIKFKLPKGNWVLFSHSIHSATVTLHSLVEKGSEELIQDSWGKTINTNEEPIQDSMGKKIIDGSKLRPYNRIDVLSSLDGKMNIDDLDGDLTKIALTYAHDGITKKDLELSIRIMADIIRHPQFYLND